MLDVSIPKPGNVHRGADFEDMTFLDFVKSAVAIGPVMGSANDRLIGQTIFDAIRATRSVTNTNTNLGIVLLLAPLAKVAKQIQSGEDLSQSVPASLAALTAEDSRLCYEAIRLAQPGGLKQTDEMDVNESPPEDLLDAMQYASEWDLVARQYVNGFAEVGWLRSVLVDEVDQRGLTLGVIVSYLKLLSEHPDSLIRRKCGADVALEASHRASQALDAIQNTNTVSTSEASEAFTPALQDFDFWLRSDGNRRNPGTSADLITAAMFVGLLEKSLQLD